MSVNVVSKHTRLVAVCIARALLLDCCCNERDNILQISQIACVTLPTSCKKAKKENLMFSLPPSLLSLACRQ